MIYCNIVDSVAMHIDNAAQVNKPQPAEEVPEELPQDPPMEILQTIEEKQEIKETDKIMSTTNEHEVIHGSPRAGQGGAFASPPDRETRVE